MAETRMRRRSPLADHTDSLAAVESRSAGVLRLAEIPFLTKLNVRVDPGSPARADVEAVLGCELPGEPNTAHHVGDVHVLWLGPDEWLVIAPPDSLALSDALTVATQADTAAGVVDVSAASTLLRLAGPGARDLLSHGCALDLHPRAFGVGACAQTRLALAGVVLLAPRGESPDHAADPVFWIVVRSSFAGYLADWLLDAALEYLDEQ